MKKLFQCFLLLTLILAQTPVGLCAGLDSQTLSNYNGGSLTKTNGLSSVPTCATYATWDSGNKSVNVVLTGGSLTATTAGAAGSVLSTLGKTTGKWYWEISIVAVTTGRNATGVADASIDLAQVPGNTSHSISYLDTGNWRFNNVDTACGLTFTGGDIVSVKWDAGAGSIEFLKNNASQCTVSTGLSGTQYAAWGDSFTGSATANFGASAFTYAVPSGYASGLCN